MKTLGSLAFLAGLALIMPYGPASADELDHTATLHCDAAQNRALVVLDGSTMYANPPIPAEIDLGMSSKPPAAGNTCRLKDGREVKVKSDHDQARPYGECGADPMAFLSLWVGSRKVFSRHYFYGGCHQGLVLKAVLLDGDKLTQCDIVAPDADGPAAAGTLTCIDRTDALANAEIDAIEYPPPGQSKLRVGAISVETSKDQAFCERFIDRDESTDPKTRGDGLIDHWGTGDIFVPDAMASPVEPGADAKIASQRAFLRHFDADNDGAVDDVLWFYGTSHYFDGDYFLIAPRDARLKQDLLDRLALGDREEDFADWARGVGISIYSGADTPYQTVRYTHFHPIVAAGRTMVWAWPTNESLLPTAMLYETAEAGKLMPVCKFQRVEENF